MNERHRVRRHRISARDRQMLAAAYWPVVAFAAALITAPKSHTHRPAQEAPR
jgi:hypothetical protein